MFVGNTPVDDIKIGNTPVDDVYVGDKLVWSAIPSDVKAHIARVTTDGGTVPEQSKMISLVKGMVANNIWNNCVFFGLLLGGVKKDGNQYVSKVYDLKGNADCSQGIATAQPLYNNTDNSLYYDTGDSLVSSASLLGILGSNPNITIAQWYYWNGASWSVNYPASLRLGSGITVNQSIALTCNGGRPAYDIFGQRVQATTTLLVKRWYLLVATKIQGVLSVDNTKLYANNIELSSLSTLPTAVPNLVDGRITIGMLDGQSADRRWNGSIGESFVFNRVLTATERQYLFDLTRSQYGV